MPVEQSSRGAFLRFAGPEFVGGLHRGTRLIEIGLIVRLLGFAGAVGIAVAARPYASGVLLITQLVAAVLSTWGWWLFTSPHLLLPAVRLRTTLRVVVVAGNLLELSVFAASAGQAPSASGMATQFMRVSPCFFIIAFGLGWLASIWLALLYAAGVARRIPNKSLTDLSLLVSWLVPVLVVGSAFGLLCFPGVILLLAAFVLYFVVIDRWRAELAKLSKEVAGRGIQTPPETGL
jgi:hypothetical protein